MNPLTTDNKMPRLLLITADASTRVLVRETVGASYYLLAASTGREGVTLARQGQPDLIVLSTRLSDGADGQICRELAVHATTRDIPVLLIGAHPPPADAASSDNVYGHLVSPFSPSALLEEVARILIESSQEPPTLAGSTVDSSAGRSAEMAQLLIYAEELEQLHQTAERQASRFRLLLEMSKDLLASHSVDMLLNIALQRVMEFTGCEGGSILLLSGSERLTVRVSLGEDAVAPGTHVPDLSRSIAGRALLERQPLVVVGRGESLGFAWRSYSKNLPFAVCLPLIAPDGQTLGVLALKNAVQVRSVDDEDLAALQMFSGDIAAAIQGSQLRERLEGSVGVLLALHEAGQVLGSSLDIAQVRHRLLAMTRRVSGLESVVLSFPDKGGRLKVWQAVGPDDLWCAARRTTAARAARRAAVAKRELRIVQIGEDNTLPPVIGYCVPLQIRDRVIGLLEIYGGAIEAGDVPAEVIGSLADVAASALENARLYEELADHQRQLQSLVRQLLIAQEEERRHLAYEVHDGLTQMVVGLHQNLQAFAGRHPPRSQRTREELHQLLHLARETVGEARQVIGHLRPTALDDFGLAVALRLEGETWRARGWEITFDEELGDERLPASLETALFRVAQEALTNVRKHAQTTRVQITLARRARSISLEIRDWGRGFQPSRLQSRTAPGERIGLAGMQERAAWLGGQCQIRSRPGAGTRILFEVPVPDPLAAGGS